MAKGYNTNKERLEAVNSFGKNVGKRAGFKCEWCESKEDLRLWDYKPDLPPQPESLAMLCSRCRDLADGKKGDPNELRSIRNALWSDIPAVAEGAARVISRCREAWVKDAIEQSFIDEELKEELLSGTQIWK
jgi:protein PhnA